MDWEGHYNEKTVRIHGQKRLSGSVMITKGRGRYEHQNNGKLNYWQTYLQICHKDRRPLNTNK
jgi:hypothetical protein